MFGGIKMTDNFKLEIIKLTCVKCGFVKKIQPLSKSESRRIELMSENNWKCIDCRKG
jgi:hypothetical protein